MDHPTADEIFISARELDKNIVHATVYNSLNYLSDKGLIRRVKMPHLPDRFDRTLKEHNHFVCEKCGRVFDLPEINLDLEKLADKHHINSYIINFFGVCENCSKEEN
jgi:Fur family peroxide stress response transcriptional regulator